MSQPIRGHGGHLGFFIGPKNTILVEDIEILLPVRFHWIPFSGFKGEVENVQADKRSGRPSWVFLSAQKTKKVGRGLCDLASCHVSLNAVQRFHRRSRKCLSQSDARAVILFFRLAQKKTQKLGRGRWDLVYCQVSLNSVQWFQRKSWKYLSQSEARAAILFFRSEKSVEDI